MSRMSLLAVTAVTCVTASLAAGCGHDSGSGPLVAGRCALQPDRPLALAMGVRSNSPAPKLPEAGEQLLERTADAGKPISLIPVDGRPKQVANSHFVTSTKNRRARERALKKYIEGVRKTAGERLKASAPEVDVLAALDKAADSAGEGGNVVLVDSGLSTAGKIDFRQDGLLLADPDDLAESIDAKELPDLKGSTVVLSGLGRTASPQTPLDTGLRRRITDIWVAIAKKSGASCVFVDTEPNDASATEGMPSVTPVSIPKPKPPTFCGETTFTEQDISFVRGKAQFRYPDEARKVLEPLAEDLKKPGRQINLIGTTSSEGGDAINVPLSKERAEAVKAELVKLGVPAERIDAEGRGSTWRHIPDTRPDGKLIPGAAARNRRVIAQESCRTS